jgi:hypothetical protein
MSEVQRFPKWLLEERRFEIYFANIGPNKGQFNVRLFSQYGRKCFDGAGASIAEAAKHARNNQEAAK